MERPTSLKKDWVLTQDAFDLLLARLDRDQERAGRQYEHIRHGLVTFFECHGGASPADLADETINRVARRLLEGKEIHADNPASYFYGVARNVLKENWGSGRPAPASLDEVPELAQLSDDPGSLHERQEERYRAEQRLECLEHCLDGLTPRDRELISEYYQGETGAKIRARRLLAKKLGIPLNALRIRALRIREKLEACVQRCLNQPVEG